MDDIEHDLLQRHHWKGDTLLRNIENEAVVASALCAKHYDLDLIAEKIQDHKNNVTRFLVFMNKDQAPKDIKKEKTSVAFRTKHHPGALLEALKIFSMANITGIFSVIAMFKAS